MQVYLIDGTYELFRSFFGAPPSQAPDGMEVGATRGLCRSLISLIKKSRVSHIGCAFDHVIESFRNRLFDGYKTGAGIDPALLAQFPLVEEATRALGIRTWPMVEFEADDALASAAARLAACPEVQQVLICSPDKDLAQCVVGERVVCLDRRRERLMTEAGVLEHFGVPPAAIASLLALCGDTADGVPGVPGWGMKSSAAVLRRYLTVDAIPADAADWTLPTPLRGAERLAAALREHREVALLYLRLTTLRLDAPLLEGEEAGPSGEARPSAAPGPGESPVTGGDRLLASLRYTGPDLPALDRFCQRIGDEGLRTLARSLPQASPAQGSSPQVQPAPAAPGGGPGAAPAA